MAHDSISVDSTIPQYVSHVSEDGRYESVSDHLHEVASMAEEFASSFNAGSWAYLAGLVHDIGKYSKEFQNRILNNGPKVDHSSAGAYELISNFGDDMALLAFAIAGHHAGLPDGGSSADNDRAGTLLSRIQKGENKKLCRYDEYEKDVVFPTQLEHTGISPISSSNKDMSFMYSFFIRMIFSSLVDADYLCTERFINGKERERASTDSLEVLRDRLEKKIAHFYPPKTMLNKVRCAILDACKDASSSARGFFTLTVPTGGGKTYASMRFALNHALAGDNAMRRIIYAVPYTSIIDQNADVYRDAFGSNNVLEHHTNFDFDSKNFEKDEANRLRLATENWDMPIVVTTNVQFFESLYGNKTSQCRKLHNIAQSVIVLDEAQMLPTKQLLPCIRALVELVANYGCSVVLCTATQPALNSILERYGKEFIPREIAPEVDKLYESFRRVTFKALPPQSDDELASKLQTHKQVLCVVNSRKEARNIFASLAANNVKGIYHLSTLMYPIHRKEVLVEIRNRLDNGLPCRVVATSLIEAGVDVDFPVIYRELNGIDSMIQAAGRCNRENTLLSENAIVYIFESSENYRLPSDIQQKMSISRPEVQEDASEIDAPQTIEEYFSELYGLRATRLDDSGVLEHFESAKRHYDFHFKEMAKKFKMIEDGSFSVIISTEKNKGDVELLKNGYANRDVVRSLSRYTVNVYENHLRNLLEAGLVERVEDADGLFILTDSKSYHEQTGLTMSAKM